MQIIPVIDLKDGIVVSAHQGKRELYKPIKSKICSSCCLDQVINSFLLLYPFKNLYIADLNAISNTGSNQDTIDKAISKNQNITFWIDNGAKPQNMSVYTGIKYRLIIGSESQTQDNSILAYSNIKNTILSLDFFPDKGYQGPSELIDNSDLWPRDIIIMSLDRVGGNSGPDFEKLKEFCQKHPEKNIIAAGGIRNELDLLKLKKIGIHHALVASALHSGIINNQTIKKLTSKIP